MQFRLSLLGAYQAEWAQVSLSFATDASRALLAYLAVEANRPHRRESLSALLWAERPQAAAFANLRQTLARLRKALAEVETTPPVLSIDAKTVEFCNAAAEIDVVRFQELYLVSSAHHHQDITECPACIARLREAVALYQGEFLHGLYLERSRPFDEWMLFKREQLHRQMLEMLRTLTSHAEKHANYVEMASFARRQLALEPWREDAHRQLMWALAADGQTGAALAHYNVCVQILAEHLDAQPSAETKALYEQIRSEGAVRRPVLAIAQSDPAPPPTETSRATSVAAYPNLDETPTVPALYGRRNQQDQLAAWLVHERCQVVALLGIGGVGKTTLAAGTVRAVADKFDTVIWRSLVNAPPLEEILRAWLHRLAGKSVGELPDSRDAQMALLLDCLRRQRCLLVLDNMESILASGQIAAYRAGYEEYGWLLQRLAEIPHAGCVLVTSRERPLGFALLEEDLPRVRSMRLAGLDPVDGKRLLVARGLSANDADASALVANYSGNPLALKVVAQTVHDLFGGDIAAFLATETAIFDDIRSVLDQQWAVLSPLEQEILIWLAIERKPVALSTLHENLLHPQPAYVLIEALRSLERRSLLEPSRPTRPGKSATGFVLQNVIMEYVTERFVAQISREIEEDDLDRLHSHALLTARAEEPVRQSQVRVILEPILARLNARLGRARWVERVKLLISRLRRETPPVPSYAAGSLLNLLLQAGVDVRGCSFAQLSVWQAHLQGAPLQDVDFRQADFKNTIFTHLFGKILALHVQDERQLLVASLASGRLRVWRVEDGQANQENLTLNARPLGTVFSPNGRILATLDADHSVSLWDVASGDMLQRLTGHAHMIWTVAFSADGALVATGSTDHTVRIWAVDSGRCLFTLAEHVSAVSALAFSADGRHLAVGSVDGEICIWELERGTLQQKLQAHTDEVHALVFAPNSRRLFSGSHDATIRVWELGEDQPVHSLQGHSGPVRSMAMSADGRLLASGGGDTFIALWDVETGHMLDTLDNLAYPTVFLTFGPDGHLLARVGTNPTVDLWDTRTRSRLNALQVYTNPVYSLALGNDDEQLLSGSADGAIRLWSLPTGRIVEVYQAHGYGVTKVAFSPDGETIASGSDDCIVDVRSVQGTQSIFRWHEHTARIECLQFSPGGDLLVSGSSDRTLRLWNLRKGNAAHVLRGHRDRVLACVFRPDGRTVASGGMDRTICLWSVADGQRIATLYGHTNAVNSVAFSPSGDLLASSSYDCTVRLWDGKSGRALDPVLHMDTVALAVAFHQDGDLLALGCADQTIRLWHLPSRKVLARLQGHSGAVESVVFQRDGRHLVSCSSDETIRIWETDTGNCVQTLKSPALYSGMNIAGVTGISEAQKAVLKILGAVEDHK